MSQLNPLLLSPRSRTGPLGAVPASEDPILGHGDPLSLTNYVLPCRMVSTLGKRRPAVSSNDLEVDFKEQTSIRRKPDEEPGSGEKNRLTPTLTT